MNRTLIDTNVLLRYLLDDVEDQSLIAEHLIDGDAWTTPEVLAEVSYVLESAYHSSREDVHAALCIIENHVELMPQQVSSQAIKVYGDSNLDFVDCMVVAYDQLNISNTLSFDKEINKYLSK